MAFSLGDQLVPRNQGLLDVGHDQTDENEQTNKTNTRINQIQELSEG